MKKILVIKHGSLGDIAISLPSMHSIRNKYPNDLIHLVTEKKFNNFFSKSKIFDKIIIDNRKDFFLKTLLFLYNLIIFKYDLVIDLQNSQRTAIYNFFFRILGSSLICSSRPFAHLRYKIPPQGKEAASKGLENQLKLINVHLLTNLNFNWLETKLDNNIITPLVLLIPGISKGNEYKQWQPEKYIEIIKYLESKKYYVCIVGTNADLPKILPIINNCKNIINKINTSPPEVIFSIAKKSELILSNDTGPGHVAALSNKNIIWLTNRNKISKANITKNKNNYILSESNVKKIKINKVIQFIEQKNLLKTIN